MPGHIPKPTSIRGSRGPGVRGTGSFEKSPAGWLLGNRGLYGAGKQLVQSVDPRTKLGALGLAGMLLPGKPNAESALAAHLGHSEFRPYQAHTGTNEEGLWRASDQFAHGGAAPPQGDIGYWFGRTRHGETSSQRWKQIHGYPFEEALGLVSNPKRARMLGFNDTLALMHKPWINRRGQTG